MNTRSNRQGGWIASFVVVAIVLVAALVGGVYVLKTSQKNDTKMEDTTSTRSSQTKPESTDKDTKSKTTTKSDESSDGESSGRTKSDTSDSTTSNTSQTSDKSKSTKRSESTSSRSSELPHTGPKETLVSLIAIGALSFAAVAYIRSRQTA